MNVEFSIYAPMRSADEDASQHKYNLLVDGKGRRWVVSTEANAGDNIYVEGGPGSQGMGGRTLTFDLVDGGSLALIGPWKTGTGALFEATGYDVRDTYLTRGVVARTRINSKAGYGSDTYEDVLYYDEDWVLGSFYRVEDIAQAIANDIGVKIPFAMRSMGGGHAGWAYPLKGVK